MKGILTKLIKSIPFIGKWKINSEKYFALHAEPGNYNSPIVTWNEVLENNYYKIGLNSGVIIHIHDIFFPFEYPKEWLKLGLCYNEAYFLRSFLMNNTNYEILFWNDYVLQNKPDFFKNKTTQTNARGGSFWMRKKKHNV
jgi:hypothetical protein